jgi:hypothetical protein
MGFHVGENRKPGKVFSLVFSTLGGWFFLPDKGATRKKKRGFPRAFAGLTPFSYSRFRPAQYLPRKGAAFHANGLQFQKLVDAPVAFNDRANAFWCPATLHGCPQVLHSRNRQASGRTTFALKLHTVLQMPRHGPRPSRRSVNNV